MLTGGADRSEVLSSARMALTLLPGNQPKTLEMLTASGTGGGIASRMQQVQLTAMPGDLSERRRRQLDKQAQARRTDRLPADVREPVPRRERSWHEASS